MRTRKLGQTPWKCPSSRSAVNVFGWTLDEQFPPHFRTRRSTVDSISSTRPTCILVSEANGGESETIIGKWLHSHGNRDRDCGHQGGHRGFGDGKVGLAPAYIARAIEDSLRRLADPTTSISIVPGRCCDADRGDAAGLRAADETGQGAVHRGVQLPGRAPAGGAGDRRAQPPAGLPKLAAALQPGGARGVS